MLEEHQRHAQVGDADGLGFIPAAQVGAEID
jgi:hypothetical protein